MPPGQRRAHLWPVRQVYASDIIYEHVPDLFVLFWVLGTILALVSSFLTVTLDLIHPMAAGGHPPCVLPLASLRVALARPVAHPRYCSPVEYTIHTTIYTTHTIGCASECRLTRRHPV